MKGQANFIEYIFTILLSVVVVIAITLLVYGFYRNLIENEVKQELRQIVIQTSDQIVRLYDVARASKAQPTNYTSLLLSEVDLNLPRQASNKNYDVLLVSSSQLVSIISLVTIDGLNVSNTVSGANAKVVARTNDDPEIEVEYDIPNIDVSVQGKASDGVNATLRYYRYNINGVLYDTIVLGPYDILVRLSGVS